MMIGYYLGVDPDTKNTAIALLYASALCHQGMYGPTVLWTDVAAVPPDRGVESRIHLLTERLDHIIGNLGYNMVETPPKPTHAIVEGQEKYPRDNVRPNDLIYLAQVAGIATAFIQAHHGINPYIVRARKWKGSVPKDVHQKRIMSKVTIGQECDYLDCNKTQQGHVIDAIGLAYYGFEQHRRGMVI